MAENFATFAAKIPDADPVSEQINAWSHAIIELLGNTPTDTPTAQTQYVTCLKGVAQTLYGSSDRNLTVDKSVFTGGSRSSRQTRRRRNGGKRNQRR